MLKKNEFSLFVLFGLAVVDVVQNFFNSQFLGRPYPFKYNISFFIFAFHLHIDLELTLEKVCQVDFGQGLRFEDNAR